MADPASSHPIATGYPARPSFLSLPREILQRIILQLDLPTAISIALTSRTLTASAELRIWRDLELCVDQLPKPELPERACVTRPGRAEVERVAQERAQQHKARLKAKVMAMIMRGDERRWGMTESIVMVPTAAVVGMATILELASPKLKSLSITTPCQGEAPRQRLLPLHETLDSALLGSTLHLPSLTHVRITRDAVRYWEVLPAITNAAPNLTHISVDLEMRAIPIGDEDTPLRFTRDTKLHQLRLCLTEVDEVFDVFTDVKKIILRSPDLRQLSICMDGPYTPDMEDMRRRLLVAAGKCERLEDVHWDAARTTEWSQDELDPRVGCTLRTGYANLRRLVFYAGSWLQIFACLPRLPSVEVIFLGPHFVSNREGHRFWDIENLTTGPPFPSALSQQPPCPLYSMISKFSTKLRRAPRLRKLLCRQTHLANETAAVFDELDDQEAKDLNIIGHIRSFKFGPEELLHARLFLPFDQLDDAPEGDNVFTAREGGAGFIYRSRDRSKRTRTFAASPICKWQHQTDLEGRVVPLQVIEQMLEVDGGSGYEQGGRGRLVSAAAWKVVTDWRDSLDAE